MEDFKNEMPPLPDFLNRSKHPELQAAAEAALQKITPRRSEPKAEAPKLTDEEKMEVSKKRFQLREIKQSPLPLASRKRAEKKLRKEIDAMKKGKTKKAEKPKALKAKAKMAAKPKKASAAKKAPKAEGESKGDKVFALIAREGGATRTELCKETGWQPHSLRSFLSVQSAKRGIKIEAERKDGETTYKQAA